MDFSSVYTRVEKCHMLQYIQYYRANLRGISGSRNESANSAALRAVQDTDFIRYQQSIFEKAL